MPVPEIRIRDINDAPVRKDGQYVLYWMIANRRLTHNFSLQRAVELANSVNKPLLIFEALRCGYQWASVRLHRFVIQGMADNQASAAKAATTYFPYIEDRQGAGSGLLQKLAENATVVVTDDFPCFFLPRMVSAVGRVLPVKLEAIDSNGIYPMRDTDRIFTRAFSLRNHLQKVLPPHLHEFPEPDPLAALKNKSAVSFDKEVANQWPPATSDELKAEPRFLSTLPIDQSVGPALQQGGTVAAQAQLDAFLTDRLERYGDDRNHPDTDSSSGLSAYLHFGHVSAHDVFSRIADTEEWSPESLNCAKTSRGSREGWWNMSPAAESFLDELITWRELGYNACCHDPNYAKFESLPDFAKKTLNEHAGDPREFIYSCDQFENADTHDEIWNAAQTQLVREGRMHNYLRMLWGKKILEWSPSPEAAIEVMIELNNRFAVDGRNPNSYSGIFWVLGRYDRAWGPERPIYGKIRYMSSDNTRRKLKLKRYLETYSKKQSDQLF